MGNWNTRLLWQCAFSDPRVLATHSLHRRVKCMRPLMPVEIGGRCFGKVELFFNSFFSPSCFTLLPEGRNSLVYMWLFTEQYKDLALWPWSVDLLWTVQLRPNERELHVALCVCVVCTCAYMPARMQGLSPGKWHTMKPLSPSQEVEGGASPLCFPVTKEQPNQFH